MKTGQNSVLLSKFYKQGQFSMSARFTRPTKLLPIFCFVAATIAPNVSFSGGFDDFDSDVQLDTPGTDYETEFAEPSSLSSYYIGANGGYALTSKFNSFVNPGYSVGAQIGYRDANYRTSIMFNYMHHDLKSAEVPPGSSYHLSSSMAGVFYDFNYDGRVVPFLGAGAGYLYVWKTGCLDNNHNCNQLIQGSRFAYELMTGVGLQYKHVRFDVRYRYFSFLKNDGFADNIFEGVFNYFFQYQ